MTACYPCNAKKANKTPDEAGMWPKQAPCRPATLPLLPPHFDPATAPVEWRDFAVLSTRPGVA